MNYKTIHIGEIIHTRIIELNISEDRILKFFRCNKKEYVEMLKNENCSTDVLLKWSKLLEYDFFRIYAQHLILYSPPSAVESKSPIGIKKNTPAFRKNIYTKEVIDFLLVLISSGEKTKAQIIKEYNIPKTTLYKWISKYSKK